MTNDDTEYGEGGPPTQRIDPDDIDDEPARPRRSDAETTVGPTVRMPGGSDEFPTRRYDPATPISPESTEILDVRPDPRAGRATGIAVAMIVLAFLVAAGVGYATRVPHPPGLVGRALVGPNGGVITFDDSGRVEIPRGALSTATTITIRRVALNQDVTVRGTSIEFKPGSVPLYTFEPNNTTFNVPIVVRIPVRGQANVALVLGTGDPGVVRGTQEGNLFVVKTQNFSFT